jgi:arylformamidase
VAGIDYEVEYNNRARVPENPALMAGWAKDAAAYRERHAPQSIAYGPGARNTIDLFPGNDDGPIVVFIHGGYWQALDGSSFSHCARGLNTHGIAVAVPSYDLCPHVTVDTIIRQMLAATRELARLGRPLVMSGHSAGGHLAACLLATDWPALDPLLPKHLVVAAYAISGLFDLVPLVETSINNALGLDQATAKAASPLLWKPPEGGSLDAVVGGNESAEYFRQSRTIVDIWGKAGIATRFGTAAPAGVAAKIIAIAEAKTIGYAAIGHAGLITVFVKAILCNWMVCLAIVATMTTNSTIGKIATAYMPVFIFFAQGFEHSVVNMFLIPTGMMMGAKITVTDWWVWNQIPVTLGNLVGGFIFTGLAIYITHKPRKAVAPLTMPTQVPAE